MPTDEPDLGYRIVHAAGLRVLTPCYDVLAGLFGLGRAFKAQVLDLAGIVDGQTVLDLGCGSGLLLRLVQERYPRSRLIALDPDSQILEIARRRLAATGTDRVESVCAGAERTGLESGSVDVALSTLAFHHIPPAAKREAAHEIARVLRPAGVLVLVDLQPLFTSRRPLREAEQRSTRMAYRTNTPQVLRTALTAAGLAVEQIDAPRSWAFGWLLFALRATKTEEYESKARETPSAASSSSAAARSCKSGRPARCPAWSPRGISSALRC